MIHYTKEKIIISIRCRSVICWNVFQESSLIIVIVQKLYFWYVCVSIVNTIRFMCKDINNVNKTHLNFCLCLYYKKLTYYCWKMLKYIKRLYDQIPVSFCMTFETMITASAIKSEQIRLPPKYLLPKYLLPSSFCEDIV